MDEQHFPSFDHQLRGQPHQQHRLTRCVDATGDAMELAFAQVYVSRRFPESSKAATPRMVLDTGPNSA